MLFEHHAGTGLYKAAHWLFVVVECPHGAATPVHSSAWAGQLIHCSFSSVYSKSPPLWEECLRLFFTQHVGFISRLRMLKSFNSKLFEAHVA